MTNLAPNPLPREMFIRILKNLYNIAGSKQYLDIASIPVEQEAQKKLNELLQPMINVSNTFAYIPLGDQEQIIEQRILEDPEFYGLNARKIWQYLNSAASRYFKQEAHKKTEEESRESNARPLTNEEWDMWIKRWQDEIQKLGDSIKIPPVSQETIERLGKEKLEKKAVAVARPEWIIGEKCGRCDGLGYICDGNEICPDCQGTKEINLVRVHADTEQEARKMYAYHKAHAK